MVFYERANFQSRQNLGREAPLDLEWKPFRRKNVHNESSHLDDPTVADYGSAPKARILTMLRSFSMPQRIVFMLFVLTAYVSTFVASGCAPTGVGDPCEPEVLDPDIAEGETVIETSSLQCRTRVCMFYNGHSFCTKRCDSHSDCRAEWNEEGPGPDEEDYGNAYCEAQVTVGSPGVIGSYCVPERATVEQE